MGEWFVPRQAVRVAASAGFAQNKKARRPASTIPHPKRNPAIAVYNSSFELIRNRRSPPDCLRLPVKACRPQPQLKPLNHVLWFKDIVSKHEHRQGKF